MNSIPMNSHYMVQVFKKFIVHFKIKKYCIWKPEDFAIAAIIIGKCPIVGPVVANKRVSDEGHEQMK